MKLFSSRNTSSGFYNLFLSVVLILSGLVLLLISMPSYTKWAIILLVIPSVFFLLRKGEHLDKRKLLACILIAIAAAIVWDNIAIKYRIWDFPLENVSGWFLGIPYEEYLFAICFTTITIGIYTSLRKIPKTLNIPHFRTIPLLVVTSTLQLVVLHSLIFSNMSSYIKWSLVFVILPSVFFLFRRGEKIDYSKMILTVLIITSYSIIGDYIFIKSGSWIHYEPSLLGRIGIVPIDDIIFAVFTAVTLIGIYTSVPHRHPLIGKWSER